MSKIFLVYKDPPYSPAVYSGGTECMITAKLIAGSWGKFVKTLRGNLVSLYHDSRTLDRALSRYDGSVLIAFRGAPNVRMIVMSDEGFTAFLLEYA